ncbi:serine hydrolase [Saccharothrix australiensis]|uniref:Beta-lactamase class A catalytic domain-containing protein n=1 Tax=Saccharothrix australiensis TaxID=2072 RepID=A0A495VXS6_9PSEU|nr:serine hydrolase [Saccharothrix australiensis]RKT53185.1 hypothetical protein C8E97_1740 [Saccharothrix australiensis]
MGRRGWLGGLALAIAGVCVAAAAMTSPSTHTALSVDPATGHAGDAPTVSAGDAVGAPDLSAAVARAVEAAGEADVAVSVLDLATGARADHRGDVAFPSASLSKLLVAVDVLGSGEVDEEDRELLRRALGASDDDAMNALWTRHDGYGAVGRVARRVGLTRTRAPADGTQWGEVELSADDLALLYRHVLTALPEAERDFLVAALSAAPQVAADGFDQAFGLLAPGLGAYAKQGWMWYEPAGLYLHSAGVVDGRYAVALLSRHGTAVDAAGDLLTGVARDLLAGLAER